MVAVFSTPGLSQLFGSAPVGPVGWAQGFSAAALASALSADAPGPLSRLGDAVLDWTRSVVDDDDHPGAYEDRVEVAERRGEDLDRTPEESVLSETVE